MVCSCFRFFYHVHTFRSRLLVFQSFPCFVDNWNPNITSLVYYIIFLISNNDSNSNPYFQKLAGPFRRHLDFCPDEREWTSEKSNTKQNPQWQFLPLVFTTFFYTLFNSTNDAEVHKLEIERKIFFYSLFIQFFKSLQFSVLI